MSQNETFDAPPDKSLRDPYFHPTKGGLIEEKARLKRYVKVRKILKDELDVLLKKMQELAGKADEASERYRPQLEKGWQAVLNAGMDVGPIRLEGTAATMQPWIGVNLETTKVGPAEIISFKLINQAFAIPPGRGAQKTEEVQKQVEGVIEQAKPLLKFNLMQYGFADTSSRVDRASREMGAALPGIFDAAGYVNSMLVLVQVYKRIKRSHDALEEVLIPRTRGNIEYANDELGSKEQDEHVRLKLVKRFKERRSAEVGREIPVSKQQATIQTDLAKPRQMSKTVIG